MKKHIVLLVFFIYPFFADAEDIRVRDYQNRDVVLKQSAQRIVALAPHIVENLFAIGAGEQIIATVDYADYPEAALEIPRVGGYNIGSVEAIVAYKPDLVIFWGSGNSQKILQHLLRLNIPVYIDEPIKIKDIAHSLLDFGRLSGNEEKAGEVATIFLSNYADLSSRYARDDKVQVFYQIWDEPLQTLNGSHITSDLINLCGGENIFGDEPSIAPVVSKETIFARDPDVILASGISTERPVWLDAWSKYPQLKAVRDEKLMFIPADISQRHSTRIMDGAQRLCVMLAD